MNWWSAQTKLGKRESRKIDNHTYLQKRGEDFAVRLHSTDIVTFKKNGDTVLNSGGWLTITTKDRINKYGPDGVRVGSEHGKWILYNSGPSEPGFYRVEFKDGITITKTRTIRRGTGVSRTELAKIERHNQYVEKLLKRYLDGFTVYKAAVVMQEDGMSDCFMCKAGPGFGGEDHLMSHLKERYYMPTLVLRAIQHANYSNPWFIFDWWKDELNRNSRFPHDFKRRLRKYFRDNLLHGARNGKKAA